MIVSKRSYVVSKGANAGKKMAVVVLQDLHGQAEVVLFPDVLEKYGDYLGKDKVVFVKGKVDRKKEKPNIFADELVALEEVSEKLIAKV